MEDGSSASIEPVKTDKKQEEHEVSERRQSIARSLLLAHSVLVEQEDEDSCLELAFNNLDVKKNNVLDRSELYMFMEEAAKHVRLEVDRELVEDAVDALIEDVGGGDDTLDHITREQFYDIFRRHPDMMRVFDDEASLRALQESVRSAGLSIEEANQAKKDREEVWSHARTHWKSKRAAIVWLFLYIFGNVFAFVYKAIMYTRNEEAQAIFGQCITVARGCAQVLNLNACLILVPLCRHFVTALRSTKFRDDWFPFDASIEIHILIGIVIALFSTAHVCAHICDFYRFARADEADIYALFGDKLGVVPEAKGARWGLLLKQPAGVTGIIMVVCMIIAYCGIYYRRKKFNVFWSTHHLLIVMLVALCCHGIGNLLEPFKSVYWIIGPLALYVIPRFLRETKCSSTQIVEASVKDGEIVSLKIEKPSKLPWKRVQAGQYAFLNIPQISCAEWHPFTLTSAPYEDHLEFAIQAVGDWTKSTRDLISDANLVSSVGDRLYPAIKVEGPIGASSQDFSKFPILVLVGAGIGVTPMISVVKQLLKHPGNMKRTILYWTIRDSVAVDWFTSVLDDIYEQDDKHVIQIRHFLTSVKYDDRDLGAVLLHYAARSKHKHTDIDILLGRQTHHQVEVGRPVWDEELRSIRQEAKELGYKSCGIFLCGPTKMAEEVDDVSFMLSRDDPEFHFYFNKETF